MKKVSKRTLDNRDKNHRYCHNVYWIMYVQQEITEITISKRKVMDNKQNKIKKSENSIDNYNDMSYTEYNKRRDNF